MSFAGALRMVLVAAHVLAGLLISALVLPWCRPARVQAIRMHWSRDALRILGVKLHATGRPAPGALIVANHVSWLDVLLINAEAPTLFVCKAEVRRWPLVGALAAANGTLFLERGRTRAAHDAVSRIAERLARGQSVALFPEGTTSAGPEVMPFRSALLEAAISAGAPLQPAALRYNRAEAAFVGETSFLRSLAAICMSAPIDAHIDLLPAVETAHASRGLLAEHARARISRRLAAHTAPETPAGLPVATPSDTRPTNTPNPAKSRPAIA